MVQTLSSCVSSADLLSECASQQNVTLKPVCLAVALSPEERCTKEGGLDV